MLAHHVKRQDWQIILDAWVHHTMEDLHDYKGEEKKEKKVYAARRHNGSLCPQRQKGLHSYKGQALYYQANCRKHRQLVIFSNHKLQ